MTDVGINKARTKEIPTTARRGWKNTSKVLSCANPGPIRPKRG